VGVGLLPTLHNKVISLIGNTNESASLITSNSLDDLASLGVPMLSTDDNLWHGIPSLV
jgi:hypothetical protein